MPVDRRGRVEEVKDVVVIDDVAGVDGVLAGRAQPGDRT